MFNNIVLVLQVLLGLLSVWNVSFLGHPARVSTNHLPQTLFSTPTYKHFLCCLFLSRWVTLKILVFFQAILPYSQALEKFAPHIQQACI
jgi:hypothetical protein